MNISKRIISLVMVLIMIFSVASIATVSVSAASYPSAFPEAYTISAKAGDVVEIKYTVFHEYNRETMTSIVYAPDGSEVASAEKNFYPSSYTTEYTLSWDTSDYPGGQYKVVSQMSFYSMYDWHDAPSSTTVYIDLEGDTSAYKGTTVGDAIEMKSGQWVKRAWTKNNDDLNCYNKFVLSSRGYITFAMKKVTDDDGRSSACDLVLYDVNGKKVWSCNTEPLVEDSFNDTVEYKIGLDKGTYYMNLDPQFYVESGMIETEYKYTFTKSDNWEIESNDDASKATSLTLGQKYNAVYCEESYASNYRDYYKFKLTKGKEYTVTIYNYSELDEGTTIVDFYDADNDEFYPDNKNSGSAKVWTFKAGKSGTYYLLLDNDGNSKPVEYQVKVATVGGDEEASSSKKPGQVKKLKTSSVKATSVKLSWSKVSGADKYTVYYSTDGKKWTKKTTTKTSYTVKKLKSGTKYQFKVVASKGSKNGKASSVVTTLTKPATVTLKSVKSSKTKTAVVKWEAVKGVTGYKVVYSTSKKFTDKTTKTATVKKYKTVKTTLKKLKKGKKYYVKVRAYKVFNKKNVYGGYSAVKSVKVK